MCTSNWSVTIYYREPTFEEAREWGPREYVWTYVVSAPDQDAARTVARSQFNEMQQLSSVSWSRDIVEMDVSPR